MGKITKLTRQDIFNLFTNGLEIENFWEVETLFYPYYGRLEEIDFLKRLYNLSSWESFDPRLQTAEEEIMMHTRNGDYTDGWIFKDKRLQLVDGPDSVMLNYLCEVFHPEVRDEKKHWKKFLDEVNKLLREDGYELSVVSKISGRDVYNWRVYRSDTELYVPFSLRNKELISAKKITLSLSNDFRYQLFNIMNDFDEVFHLSDETDWNYTKNSKEFVLEDIKRLYSPKHYVDKCLVDVSDFEDLESGTSPFIVLDTVESFCRHVSEPIKFQKAINSIFKLNNFSLQFIDGLIVQNNSNNIFRIDPDLRINEEGIYELVNKAETLYSEGNYSAAVEKIWDAFERIKTYYSPTLKKNKSAERVIDDISKGDTNIRQMIEDEFRLLTDIGNSYCIRHHEVGKINIRSEIHFEYFYKRCFSLISVVLKELQ